MSNLTAQQIYKKTRGSRKEIVGTYFIKDASDYEEWEEFVSLYRQVHKSNEDLDKPFIRNMNQVQLQRAIMNMKAFI